MKKVYVVGSFKDLEVSKSFAQQLEDRGFQSLISNPGDRKGIDGCLERIDAADVIYISNPRGVVGKSVSVDVGYALAKGKPIFATNVISDPPLSHRIRVASSVDELLIRLNDPSNS